MTARLAIPLIGTLLTFAGCGGSDSTTTVTEVSTTTTSSTTSTTTETESGPPQCLDLIDEGKEGRCLSRKGALIDLVHRDSTLKMKTLSARLVDVTTADSVSTSGITEAASGEYVIVTLDITNRLDAPAEFGGLLGEQTVLVVGEKVYTEDFDASNQADQQSFLSQAEEIQPGQSQTGHVIYDLPADLAAKVAAGDVEVSAIQIVDFGEDLQTAGRLGSILLSR